MKNQIIAGLMSGLFALSANAEEETAPAFDGFYGGVEFALADMVTGNSFEPGAGLLLGWRKQTAGNYVFGLEVGASWYFLNATEVYPYYPETWTSTTNRGNTQDIMLSAGKAIGDQNDWLVFVEGGVHWVQTSGTTITEFSGEYDFTSRRRFQPVGGVGVEHKVSEHFNVRGLVNVGKYRWSTWTPRLSIAAVMNF